MGTFFETQCRHKNDIRRGRISTISRKIGIYAFHFIFITMFALCKYSFSPFVMFCVIICGSVVEWLGCRNRDLRSRVRLPVTTPSDYFFLRQVTVFGR